MYNERLRMYFKSIGVSQREAADRLGHAPSMMSRYLSGVSVFDAQFVVGLVREFPEVDLKYIFSDGIASQQSAPELQSHSDQEPTGIEELNIIQQKLDHIRKVLENKSR